MQLNVNWQVSDDTDHKSTLRQCLAAVAFTPYGASLKTEKQQSDCYCLCRLPFRKSVNLNIYLINSFESIENKCSKANFLNFCTLRGANSGTVTDCRLVATMTQSQLCQHAKSQIGNIMKMTISMTMRSSSKPQ